MTASEVAQGFTSAAADDDRWVDPRLARLAATAAARGTVLLANDGVLPLDPTARVAVFGRVQIDWFAVGYGSGGDVNAPYTTNLLDSLVEAGIAVDADLAETYRRWCAAQPVAAPEWGRWPRFHPEMELDEAAVGAAAARADVAVVVIGRAAGEDRENVLEPGSYYLTQTERLLLERVTARFERTVVVVDSGNVMDLSWAEELGVSALLLAWPGGMEGARAVADVLRGAVEPGGRLPDTIARRYEDCPSAASFGDPEANHYAEDVFVGYRYFETFAPDAVQFPFGFGLGYTTFNVVPGAPVREGDVVRLTASAANTGERAGSTVVQVYASPASGGALASPARELVAFARTAELAPGGTQELDLSFPVERLASFDDSGATEHRNAWVLEAGAHPLHVGLSVRDTAAAGAVDVGAAEVLEQLEEALAPSPEHPFDRMTPVRGRDGSVVVGWEPVPTATVDLRERIVSLDSSRGEVLDDVFRGVDRIESSEAGRSFLGFHELLMDPESSARLDDDLETVLDRDFTARLPDADLRFLRRWRSTLAQESASVRRTMTGLSRSLNRFVRSRAFEEHRRLGAELAEAQRLAARLAAHTAPQTQLGIDLALTSVPMASIGSWRMRNPADTAVSEEIHGHEAARLDLEEVRRIVRASEIDLAELVDSVEAVLAERGAATVGEVLADRPATQGLASVVGLLLLARRRGQEVAGDEAVAWTTSGGRERSARIPRFLFTDRTEKSGDA